MAELTQKEKLGLRKLRQASRKGLEVKAAKLTNEQKNALRKLRDERQAKAEANAEIQRKAAQEERLKIKDVPVDRAGEARLARIAKAEERRKAAAVKREEEERFRQKKEALIVEEFRKKHKFSKDSVLTYDRKTGHIKVVSAIVAPEGGGEVKVAEPVVPAAVVPTIVPLREAESDIGQRLKEAEGSLFDALKIPSEMLNTGEKDGEAVRGEAVGPGREGFEVPGNHRGEEASVSGGDNAPGGGSVEPGEGSAPGRHGGVETAPADGDNSCEKHVLSGGAEGGQ